MDVRLEHRASTPDAAMLRLAQIGPSPMLVTPAGMLRLHKLEQAWNAYSPMFLRLAGSVIRQVGAGIKRTIADAGNIGADGHVGQGFT